MPSSSAPTRECWPEEAARCGGRTPTKPSWSEVIVFREVFLRLKVPLVEAPIRFKECYKRQSYLDELRPLTGVGLPVIISPPAGECWPELGADVEAVLRRTRARRRWQRRLLACSGEDNPYGSWDFPPGNGLLAGVEVAGNNLSSFGRMLAGASASAARSSSTSTALSELTHAYSRLLRRSHLLSKELDFAPVAGTILFA